MGKFPEIFTVDERLDFVSAYGDRIEYENLVVEGDKVFSYPVYSFGTRMVCGRFGSFSGHLRENEK